MELKSTISVFFNDIVNFSRGGRVLGVDIGTVSLKIAELSKRAGAVTLENYGLLETKGYLERGNEAIQTSSLKLVERDVAGLIKTLLQEIKPKTKIAFASIPTFAAFTTTFEMPLLSYQETAKAVTFQARQYIPIPISETAVEWIKTQEFENQRGQRYQRILITAFPNEVIKKYRAIFKMSGLTLNAVEVENFSLVRALMTSAAPPTLLMDIGAESTTFTIAEGTNLQYLGQTDYGGVSLTQAAARSLSISSRRAEEIKRRRGLIGGAGEYELSTVLLPFLDVIIQESSRVRTEYERIYGRKIKRFVLIGGSADLPGIERYITSQLGFYAEEPLLFANIKYPVALEPAAKSLSRTLPIAVGSALKGFI
jgi:type IV pilus assembly protein PilM